jgi:hypothetical protein
VVSLNCGMYSESFKKLSEPPPPSLSISQDIKHGQLVISGSSYRRLVSRIVEASTNGERAPRITWLFLIAPRTLSNTSPSFKRKIYRFLFAHRRPPHTTTLDAKSENPCERATTSKPHTTVFTRFNLHWWISLRWRKYILS